MRIDSIKIKLIMAEQEINQAKLAEQCGVARQNISVMLARGSASPAKVNQLASILGVPARELVKEE